MPGHTAAPRFTTMTRPPALPVLAKPRINLGNAIAIGPGKIRLLRAVGETRSIAAAARQLRIPYKRAWLLIETLNQGFGRPLVETVTGGKGGGGARLTPLGQQLIVAYDTLAQHLDTAASAGLKAIRRLAP